MVTVEKKANTSTDTTVPGNDRSEGEKICDEKSSWQKARRPLVYARRNRSSRHEETAPKASSGQMDRDRTLHEDALDLSR